MISFVGTKVRTFFQTSMKYLKFRFPVWGKSFFT